MKFYRKATYRDFREEGFRFEGMTPNGEMWKEVEEHLKTGDTVRRFRAMNLLQRTLNIGVNQSKQLVDEYQTYLRALEDFKEGKDVYTDY